MDFVLSHPHYWWLIFRKRCSLFCALTFWSLFHLFVCGNTIHGSCRILFFFWPHLSGPFWCYLTWHYYTCFYACLFLFFFFFNSVVLVAMEISWVSCWKSTWMFRMSCVMPAVVTRRPSCTCINLDTLTCWWLFKQPRRHLWCIMEEHARGHIVSYYCTPSRLL